MEPNTKIVVPGTLESTATIRNFVKDAITLAGIDRKRGYRLQLAVDEIATNIVTHGYMESGRTGEIEAQYELTDEDLTISLSDSAVPFDPYSIPPPSNLEDPLEERPYGGYGVSLAIQNVDRFKYEFCEGRNWNIFTLKREQRGNES
jgi:anti-sigma regulatory factor (Ser/Thr protein kinase)